MKKLLIILTVVSLALFFTAGCVEQQKIDYEGAEAVENLPEDDNLDVALDELDQLENVDSP